jgi:hypothetical protein
MSLVSEPGRADVVLYPVPEWRDTPDAVRLRDVMPRHRARLFVYSTNDDPVPWAPGAYASLSQSRAGRGPFCGAPYLVHHAIEGGLTIHDSTIANADLLWSFVGTVRTCPRVRQQIVGLKDSRGFAVDTAAWDSAIRWQWSTESGAQVMSDYAQMLRRSKFVLCPRGVGPSSMRLFEAMEAGRCPVIVSDEWLAPLLVDWDRCSLRVAERDVAILPEILRGAEDRAAQLGSAARVEWEKHFAPRSVLRYLTHSAIRLNQPVISARSRASIALSAIATPAFQHRVGGRVRSLGVKPR